MDGDSFFVVGNNFSEKKDQVIMKRSFYSIAILFFWLSFSGQMCTKEIVYSKDFYTTPQKAYFQTEKVELLTTIQTVLERLGYEMQSVDKEKGNMVTGWRPVEGDSHYFDLFGTRDYGTSDGAYYQLLVDVTEEGGNKKVAIATKVKTIVGKLESTGKVEKRILSQLEDLLRSPQIEMSNVGVRKK